jgi:hypothetical protein
MRTPTLPPIVRSVRGTFVSLLIALAGATTLGAQSVSVTSPPPGLTFGVVLPGVPTPVLPTDPVRSGRFELTYIGPEPKNVEVEVTFSLPSMLSSPEGSMPITFGPGSAGFSLSGSIDSQAPFDPTASSQPLRLSDLGRGTFFLGGTLTPSLSQPSGSYSGSVTITVSLTGQ